MANTDASTPKPWVKVVVPGRLLLMGFHKKYPVWEDELANCLNSKSKRTNNIYKVRRIL